MALQECRLNLDRKLKELRPHGTLEFPEGTEKHRFCKFYF